MHKYSLVPSGQGTGADIDYYTHRVYTISVNTRLNTVTE